MNKSNVSKKEITETICDSANHTLLQIRGSPIRLSTRDNKVTNGDRVEGRVIPLQA